MLGGTKGLPSGTLQERIVVDAKDVEDAPEHLSDAEAAALPLTGLTAWRAVWTKGGVGPGKKVLVTGIGGGVALMALLFATSLGAEVWVSSGIEEKVERAKSLGAKGGVIYKEEGWEKKLLKMAGGELDVIIDGAGGDIVAKSVRLLRVRLLFLLCTAILTSLAQLSKYPTSPSPLHLASPNLRSSPTKH